MNDWRDEIDEEFDDEPDDEFDETDAPATIRCPACSEEIFEDTPRCPACGHFIQDAERLAVSRPAWVFATALLCLGIALWWALG